eukprot:NODE_53_length_30760_cov_1.203712.p16 type:complete len:103 gc:universal NODE_53_length_30760_cov_1.203712:27026-27334(+)
MHIMICHDILFMIFFLLLMSCIMISRVKNFTSTTETGNGKTVINCLLKLFVKDDEVYHNKHNIIKCMKLTNQARSCFTENNFQGIFQTWSLLWCGILLTAQI